MSAGQLVVVAFIAGIALLWLAGPWVYRRNTRIEQAQESIERQSHTRGEP